MKSVQFNRISDQNTNNETDLNDSNHKSGSSSKKEKGKSHRQDKEKSSRLRRLMSFDGQGYHQRYEEYKKNTSRKTRVFAGISLLCSLFLLTICVCTIFMKNFNLDIIDCRENMEYTIGTIEQRAQFSNEILSYHEMMAQDALMKETKLMKLRLDSMPDEEWGKGINTLLGDDPNAEYYLLSDRKVVLKSQNAGRLPLSEEQLADLTKNYVLQVEEDNTLNVYCMVRINGYNLISVLRDVEKLYIQDIRDSFGYTQTVMDGGIIVYNPNTNQIYAKETYLPGIKKQIDEQTIVDRAVKISPFKEQYSIWDLLQDADTYQIIEKQLDKETSVIVFHSMDYCMITTIYASLVPILCFVLISLTVIFQMIYFRVLRAKIREQSEVKHLFGNLYIDKLMAAKTASLFVIAEVILILMSIYLFHLNDLSYENIQASYNIKNINIEKTNDIDSARLITELRDAEMAHLLDKTALLIESDPCFQNDDSLKKTAHIVGVEEITLFDSRGVSTASSSQYTGYKLVKDEATGAEDPMVSLLESPLNAKMVRLEEETGHSHYGVKRKQQTGLIRFELLNTHYQYFLDRIQNDSILIEADFGDSDIMYFDIHHPERLSLAEAGAREIKYIDNEISADALHDGYFGTNKLGETTYYLNIGSDQNAEGSFFIDAQKNKEIFIYVGAVVDTIVRSSVLLYLVLWLCGFIFVSRNAKDIYVEKRLNTEAENSDGLFSEQQSEAVREKKMLLEQMHAALQRSYSRGIFELVFCCIISFIFFFLLDILKMEANVSMLKYLYVFDWDKGFNIFSFTMILFYCLAIWVIVSLVIKLLKVTTENMGPAGLTLGRLLISFIRFLGLLVAALVTLSMLGVNTGTILASAGLTSVIIGIGAQSTVNNILAGLFIIFEGNFQVGEIVSINGWMGVIKEIGVRTTIIESYGYASDYKNLRVINNSDMKDITNHSRNDSMAIALIPIPYETDLDKLDDIFRVNADLLASMLPNITDGPFYDGVVRLDDSAKMIRFRVRCKEADRTLYEVRLLQYGTMMLEQNGIEVPFNQLVLREFKNE